MKLYIACDNEDRYLGAFTSKREAIRYAKDRVGYGYYITKEEIKTWRFELDEKET